MRLPLLLLPLALALPMGAQGFEGTMSMRVGAPDGTMMDVKYMIKGDKMGMTATAPASAGPLAGSEVRMIIDQSAKTMTMMMPLPAGMGNGMLPPDTKGLKMVNPIGSGTATEGSNTPVEYKKLGTSQTIAGLKCDDYEASADGQTTKICFAPNVGMFAYPNLGGGMNGRGRGAAAPGWAKGLSTAPGFPLKVWSADGKVSMEVTAIDRTAVPLSAFEVPAGYVDLSAMMGGRRP
ncbi:MAG: DUF4412 domain-containing protein [Gemmatimonadales bacterium]|nr:DUF4412 domain-containing protein [Gemmatimonadales bacterium]